MFFGEKQNLINELRKAQLIKANQEFKISLYERLAEADSDFAIKLNKQSFIKKKHFDLAIFGGSFRKSPIFILLSLMIAIIVLAASGAGITFASQLALPGEILYPIKIASEKARVVLASDDDKKAQLYFEFSAKRLEEIAELAKDGASDPKLAEIAVENYKKELNNGQTILFSEKDEKEAEKAADLLADITSKNKEVIAKIGTEAKNYRMADSLKRAWEETIEHNDKAVLITLKDKDMNYREFSNLNFDNEHLLLQATSSLAVDSAREKKVINKIAEAERKISETDKYLSKKKEKGIDIFEAETKINSAKGLIGEAKDLLNQSKYESAFNKAKEAQKIANSAKKIVEYINGDDDEDKLEMFKNYYFPDRATTSAIFNQPASIIHNINNIREKDNEKSDNGRLNKNEKKDDYNQERRRVNNNKESGD